jgi:thiosulfate dehydrogenase [quinone] large subunit
VGNVAVEWLFMLGLLGIGLALILGVGLRVAAVAGTVLLLMMWLAELPLEQNPIIDDHLIYAGVLWVAALGVRQMSLFDRWSKLSFVKKNKWLW